MKLLKISETYRKDTNHIVNYFVLKNNDKPPVVYTFPFFVASSTFVQQLNKQNLSKSLPLFDGEVTHACYDVSANRVYFPEIESQEEARRIEKSDTGLSLSMVILKTYNKVIGIGSTTSGDPNKTFRIRKLGNFFSAAQFIKKNIVSNHVVFNPNLLVIEADLSEMPITAKNLKIPANYESTFYPGNKTIAFIKNGNIIYTTSEPFIFINMSNQADVTESEKDRILVENYKQYVEAASVSKNFSKESLNDSLMEIQIFEVKYLLSLGWSVEQLCQSMITTNNVNNAMDILSTIGPKIIIACMELERQGEKNLLKKYYYYIVGRTSKFPINIPKTIDTNKQNKVIQIISYNPENEKIVLRSQLYINEDVCKKILSTEDVIIVDSNPEDGRIRSKENLNKNQSVEKEISSIVVDIKNSKSYNPKKNLFFEQITNHPKFNFEGRKISDFIQASEKIKQIISRISEAKNTKIQFEDLPVYLGPFQEIKSGFAGGYFSEKRCQAEGIQVPISIFPGLNITPPCILVDTSKNKTVAYIYDVLIHEYVHRINELTGVESPQYKFSTGTNEEMITYLSSPDEIESHVQQSMYLLSIGMSQDQIMRRFLTEVPSFERLAVAKKYYQIIKEASERLHKQSMDEDFAEEQVEKSKNSNDNDRKEMLENRMKFFNED